MDRFSYIHFDDESKTINIDTKYNAETVEALGHLKDIGVINPHNFQRAHFSSRNQPTVEITSNNEIEKYQKIIIHSVDLRSTDSDIATAIYILRFFNLYYYDSIRDVLQNPDLYIIQSRYDILVNKSGLFQYETKYGYQFIYD